MAERRADVAKYILVTLTTGPNTVWSAVAASAFLGLMALALMALGSGPGFLAGVIGAGAASLLMAFRGVLARPQPAWYRRILQALAVTALLVAIAAAAVVGVSIVLRFAQ
jgi:hypothetical protein